MVGFLFPEWWIAVNSYFNLHYFMDFLHGQRITNITLK